MSDDRPEATDWYARDPRSWSEVPRHAQAVAEFRALYGVPGTALPSQLAQHGVHLMRADAAVLLLRGPDGLTWHGAVGCVAPDTPSVPRDALAERAMAERGPLFLDDATAMREPYRDVEALGWRCAAAMPFVVDDVVVGALLVGRMTGVPWGTREHRAFDTWMSLEAIRAARRGRDLPGERAAADDGVRLADVFRRMPIAACVLDEHGRLAVVNEAFCALAERSAERLAGRAMGEVLTPVASESAAAYLEELLAGRRLGFAAVCNLRLSSGAKRRVRVLAGTLRYGNLGSPLHVLVLEDATSAEAEELGMRERERRLLLAQRRDSMSQLAGGLAHEYNNALAAIAGLASLLRDDLPPGDARRADAEDIIVVAQSASDLTRRLLDLSAGRLSERATLDLREVLRGFVAVLRRVLPSTIDVRVDLPSAAVPATIDRTQVEQALFGLVLNARDAMPAGGRLDLSLERVQAADGVPRARIGIADTGPGISALVRERLWTPFFSTKPDGAGLGLSFGLAVLREHGGDLRLESPPENGAVFGAYLPVAVAPDGAGTSAAAAPAAAEPQGRRVLLVEDERLVRATTARVLSKAGYTVTVAVDGEEALRLFEQAPDLVDVLVTDLQMPRIAGVDLVNRVRRLRPQLPVVVTSAHPAAEDDDRVLRAQRTARLRKPFPMAALLETLAQVLDEGGKG